MSNPGDKWWPPNGYLAQWILDQFPAGYRGHAVDVGASDGISVNTTWALEKKHDWTVVSVEPNPAFFPFLVKGRAMVEKCACGAHNEDKADFFINQDHPESFSALKIPTHPEVRSWERKDPWLKIEVPVKTLDDILSRWEFPKLDALAIDVEGTEMDVLRGCDLARWKPKVVVVESWDDIGPCDPYLTERGYQKRAKSVHNQCWVQRNGA